MYVITKNALIKAYIYKFICWYYIHECNINILQALYL